MTKQNKTPIISTCWALLILAFGAFASLLPQSALAHDTIRVTIHRYDGESGHDSQGNHTYRAKVHHGHHYYYVYMHQPLPDLAHHMHEKTPVAVNSTGHWLTISVDGSSARIHKVVKIGHD